MTKLTDRLTRKRFTEPKGITMSTTTNTRPVRVLNESVLMFVKITQVLNVRDDLGDKIKHTSFYNDLASAKTAAYDLSAPANVGYLWMTQTFDTLTDSGEVERVNHNFMFTKRSQWVRKETKAYTIEASAARTVSPADDAPEGPAKDENSPF